MNGSIGTLTDLVSNVTDAGAADVNVTNATDAPAAVHPPFVPATPTRANESVKSLASSRVGLSFGGECGIFTVVTTIVDNNHAIREEAEEWFVNCVPSIAFAIGGKHVESTLGEREPNTTAAASGNGTTTDEAASVRYGNINVTVVFTSTPGVPSTRVRLNSTVTDDGIIEEYLWTHASGTSALTLTQASGSSASAVVAGLQDGPHVIRLRARDNWGVWGESNVTIHVAPQRDSDGDGIPDELEGGNETDTDAAVSYTHLTLPTNREV